MTGFIFHVLILVTVVLSLVVATVNVYENSSKYAMRRMVSWYIPGHGRWLGHLSYDPDWCRANAFESFANYYQYQATTSEKNYLWQVAKDVKQAQGNLFYQNAEYFDDVLWWSLAYQRWYEIAKSHQANLGISDEAKELSDYFLSVAKGIVKVVYEDSWNRDASFCNGGCYWSRTSNYKNAITNELFLAASSKLAYLLAQDGNSEESAYYANLAKDTMSWFLSSGMIQAQSSPGLQLIVDGLDSSCKPTGAAYTYNQGVILGGIQYYILANLAKDTTEASLLVNLADSLIQSVAKLMTNQDHILTEKSCGDGALFKGIYSRYLNYFASYGDASTSKIAPFSTWFLQSQMEALWQHNCDSSFGYFGADWTSASYDSNNYHNLQVSSIELFNSVSQNNASAAEECSNRGVKVSGSCACDDRYSGSTCQEEVDWTIFFNKQSITLTASYYPNAINSDASLKSFLLCEKAAKTSGETILSLCKDDDEMTQATLQVEKIDNKLSAKLKTSSGKYVSNKEFDSSGSVKTIAINGSDVQDEDLTFNVIPYTSANSAQEEQTNPFHLEYLFLQSTATNQFIVVDGKKGSITFTAVSSSTETPSTSFIANKIQVCK